MCLCVLLFVGCHRSTRLFDQSNVQINPIVMALHKSLFCFKFQRSLLLITTAHTFVIDYTRKRSISFPSLRLSVYLIRWNVYVEVVQICLSLVAFIASTCLVTQRATGKRETVYIWSFTERCPVQLLIYASVFMVKLHVSRVAFTGGAMIIIVVCIIYCYCWSL